MNDRIFYFCIDSAAPSGGIRTIHRHVSHLVRAGIPAFVMHQVSPFKPKWFSDDVPVHHLNRFGGFGPSDIIVVPEDSTLAIASLSKLSARRKVVFCQNHFYAIPGMGNLMSWRAATVTHVLASSQPIADFVADKMGFPRPPVAHYAIDHELFQPRQKKMQIAFMPRKRPNEAAFIVGVCMRDPICAGVQWVRLDGLNEKEVARVLGESAIFLSFSNLEGFGLPPIEAMASGCLVIGYHGGGGLEYANNQNGIWLDDPLAIVNAITASVTRLRANDPAVAAMIEAGRDTASKYTFERQANDVISFARSLLAQ